MIRLAEGIPPQEFKKQLRRFAKEVMPAFRATRAEQPRKARATG
jgi:hypothetical protein